MNTTIKIFVLLVIFHCSYAPPVTPEKGGSKEPESGVKDDLEDYMEYHRYLKEVVQALESDSDFRDKLEKADETDIRTGKIAEQLDFVNHNVRTQLDEIKRREMERLKHLATKEFELTNNIDTNVLKVSSDHLDDDNPHTFEIEDLKRLIKQTTMDLAEADKKRREEFKEYEMQKEFEKHQKMDTLNEKEKKEYEEKIKQEEKLQKQHAPLHHPGSKQQLEEVWEKQDHMDNQEFNPKVFFVTHDLDGNGVWDADEVKALFIKELDKMYSRSGNHTDLRERHEEMERMREHVFQENDLNRDGLIDYNEFMLQTKRNDFERDQGWQGIDENQVYSQDEYEAYQRKRMEEMRYLQERGLMDAHGQPIHGAIHDPQYYPPSGNYQQLPPKYQNQYYQQHPNQIPPQYQHLPDVQNNHILQAQMQHGKIPQAQMQYGQVPHQAQMQHGQVPQQAQMQHGQVPQHAQMQHGQVPQQAQMQHGQVPQQAQMQHGQVPQHAQMQYGQMPQQAQIPQGKQSQQGQVLQQGQMSQGQVPQQGQVQREAKEQQGQVPQSQITQQGQVPQGQAPQGQVPQGQVPQGQMPHPGQVPQQGQVSA